MAVDFYELDGYPQENRDNLGNFQATRKLLVAWDDRSELRESLLAGNGQIYPYITAFGARVTGVASVPFGKLRDDPLAPSRAAYDYAMFTVRYDTPKTGEPVVHPDPAKAANPETMLSETLEPSVEALRLPHTAFEWTDGTPLAEEEAPVRTVYRMTYALTRFRLTALPDLKNLVYKINDATVSPVLMAGPYDAPDWSFPPHTLLFQPPTVNYSAADDGSTRLDVTYRMHYKEEGWRTFWRSSSKSYEAIREVGGGPTWDQPAAASFAVLFP